MANRWSIQGLLTLLSSNLAWAYCSVVILAISLINYIFKRFIYLKQFGHQWARWCIAHACYQGMMKAHILGILVKRFLDGCALCSAPAISRRSMFRSFLGLRSANLRTPFQQCVLPHRHVGHVGPDIGPGLSPWDYCTKLDSDSESY